MALTTWQPMTNLLKIHDDMSKVFDEFFGRHGAPQRTNGGEWDWVPPVDILETGDHVEIHAEIPGLSEKDVHVSVTGNVLTFNGEKKHENDNPNGNYHRVERNYGRFQRAFTLPSSLQMDHVKAKFKNGVLTISIPKAEAVKPKEIQISVE